MNRRTIPFLLAAASMLVLIFDGQAALAGCADGIRLCLSTVIPSLFPFIFLSIIMTGSPGSVAFLSPLATLLHIPKNAQSLLVAGFLGGYPIGAQSVAERYRAKCLSKQQAERFLAFCSNAGPAFFFGMLGSVFHSKLLCGLLWGIHIVSAILVGCIFPNGEEMKSSITTTRQSATGALQTALRSMATICGWVILFRMLLVFLQRWFLWMLPKTVQIVLCGILELTNGCILLPEIESEFLRFCVAAGITAFGGLCVTMQTASVIQSLSLRFYLLGKLLQTIFSLLLSVITGCILFQTGTALFILWFLAALCLPAAIIIWAFYKNRGSNHLSIGV